MSERTYLLKRRAMFRGSSKPLPPGRPFREPGLGPPLYEWHDTLDEDHDRRYNNKNLRVHALNLLDAAEKVANHIYETARSTAQRQIVDLIRDQLAPGQTVVVDLTDFDFSSENYNTIAIGRPGAPTIRATNPKPDARILTITSPSKSNGTNPETTTFLVPSSTGNTIITMPPNPSSPAEARPGRGEMDHYFERWKKDSGLIDLDFNEYEKRTREPTV